MAQATVVEKSPYHSLTLVGQLSIAIRVGKTVNLPTRREGVLFTGRSPLFSRFRTACQSPLVCVPTCQPFTLALAHVHFQFVSNPAVVSSIPYLQEENEIVT